MSLHDLCAGANGQFSEHPYRSQPRASSNLVRHAAKRLLQIGNDGVQCKTSFRNQLVHAKKLVADTGDVSGIDGNPCLAQTVGKKLTLAAQRVQVCGNERGERQALADRCA